MPLRQRDQKRLPLPDHGGDVLWQPLRRCADECPIHLPRLQRFQLRRCGEIGKMDLAIRMALAKNLEQPHEPLVQQRADKRQPQPRALARAGPARRLGRAIQPHENAARVVQVERAGGRERHRPRAPLKQLQRKLLLQRLDLPRQRRLADMQPPRRPRKIQLLRHRHKAFQLPDTGSIHAILVSVSYINSNSNSISIPLYPLHADEQQTQLPAIYQRARSSFSTNAKQKEIGITIKLIRKQNTQKLTISLTLHPNFATIKPWRQTAFHSIPLAHCYRPTPLGLSRSRVCALRGLNFWPGKPF